MQPSNARISELPPIAITMGEPGGVGGEIVVGAWQALRGSGGPAFFSLDDPERLRVAARNFGVSVIEISEPAEAYRCFDRALPVLPEPLATSATPGLPSPENAGAVIRSIERAVGYTMSSQASAVVTNPVDKKAVREGTGLDFCGHTEFLACFAENDAKPVMMLAADSFRVVPVTVHIALRQVFEHLSAAAIVHSGCVTANALEVDFGIPNSRIAVAALNPHAGEGGMFGTEEETIIRPAISALRSRGVNAVGPFAADTLFVEAQRPRYDAVLCMYHDQALIPLKSLYFRKSANITLGLPFVRTSPAHGVAYDIAGTGTADPASLVVAIRFAFRLAGHRAGGTV